MSIFDQTLKDIEKIKEFSNLYIAELYLRSSFTVVALSNGDIGSAGNYDVQGNVSQRPKYDPLSVEKDLMYRMKKDPLLLNYLRVRDQLFQQSLYTSIISALSQDLLTDKQLSGHDLRLKKVQDWGIELKKLIRTGDTVTLVGFGGGLSVFLCSKIKKLYISDLAFNNYEFLEFALEKVRERVLKYNFEGHIIFTDGENNKEIIENSNLAFITGSALCNGTMEDLLDYAKSCREIIIQGPSASIFPVEFFKRNVTHVFTTIKVDDELALGKLYGAQILQVVDRNYVHIHRA